MKAVVYVMFLYVKASMKAIVYVMFLYVIKSDVMKWIKLLVYSRVVLFIFRVIYLYFKIKNWGFYTYDWAALAIEAHSLLDALNED